MTMYSPQISTTAETKPKVLRLPFLEEQLPSVTSLKRPGKGNSRRQCHEADSHYIKGLF